MKFSLDFTETYPHPPEKVWRALTDAKALGQWLMENDFVPEAGREFTLRCDDGSGGTDVYLCKLVEYEPERRMLWSWLLESRKSQPPTMVEFQIEEVEGGTRVTVTHSGDRDEETVGMLKSGWRAKLGTLATALGDG